MRHQRNNNLPSSDAPLLKQRLSRRGDIYPDTGGERRTRASSHTDGARSDRGVVSAPASAITGGWPRRQHRRAARHRAYAPAAVPPRRWTRSPLARPDSPPECRDAQDAKWDIPVPISPSLVTTAFNAPAALRPCRFATTSQARCWLRSTPTNGLTACRMRLHMPFGVRYHSHLRPYARAYAYRGLRALASLSMARSVRSLSPVGSSHRAEIVCPQGICSTRNPQANCQTDGLPFADPCGLGWFCANRGLRTKRLVFRRVGARAVWFSRPR
jgi:hypothetical protein